MFIHHQTPKCEQCICYACVCTDPILLHVTVTHIPNLTDKALVNEYKSVRFAEATCNIRVTRRAGSRSDT